MPTRRPLGQLGLGLLVVLAAGLAVRASAPAAGPHDWSPGEVALLRSLSLDSLPPLPPDPSNRYADDPRAARLGRRLFFDKRLSKDGSVSCGTCHLPGYSFTDRLRRARGMAQVRRRTMPLIGMAYQEWFFWDGRKDSLWSQALAPPENPEEHGISRTACALLIYDAYRGAYEAVFGPMIPLSRDDCPPIARPDPADEQAYRAWMSMTPDKRRAITGIYVNMGKAIAAFMRTLATTPSRFDRYVAGLVDGRGRGPDLLSADEVAGLRLFVGKARCTNCHNGPLLTNGEFHATGVADDGEPDLGRAEGIPLVRKDEFRCDGPHSDADPQADCAHVRFMDDDAAKYRSAFKTPTLRNVADRPPYMHAGQLASLAEVLREYRAAARPGPGADLEHATLTDRELALLEVFLGTLSAEIVERR